MRCQSHLEEYHELIPNDPTRIMQVSDNPSHSSSSSKIVSQLDSEDAPPFLQVRPALTLVPVLLRPPQIVRHHRIGTLRYRTRRQGFVFRSFYSSFQEGIDN